MPRTVSGWPSELPVRASRAQGSACSHWGAAAIMELTDLVSGASSAMPGHGGDEEASNPGGLEVCQGVACPTPYMKTSHRKVRSSVCSGPPEEARTPREDRCVKDHRDPSHISKMVPPTIHLGPVGGPGCAEAVGALVVVDDVNDGHGRLLVGWTGSRGCVRHCRWLRSVS